MYTPPPHLPRHWTQPRTATRCWSRAARGQPPRAKARPERRLHSVLHWQSKIPSKSKNTIITIAASGRGQAVSVIAFACSQILNFGWASDPSLAARSLTPYGSGGSVQPRCSWRLPTTPDNTLASPASTAGTHSSSYSYPHLHLNPSTYKCTPPSRRRDPFHTASRPRRQRDTISTRQWLIVIATPETCRSALSILSPLHPPLLPT